MVTQIYCNASRVDKLRVVFRGLCFVVLSDFARLSAGIGLVIFFEKIFRGRSNPTSPNTHPHSNLDNPPHPDLDPHALASMPLRAQASFGLYGSFIHYPMEKDTMSSYKLFTYKGDIAGLVPAIQIEVDAEKEMEDAEVVSFLEDMRDEDCVAA